MDNRETTVVVGSPEEIRTPVSGSNVQRSSNQTYFIIRDADWVVSGFWQYCKIEERLSDTVSRDYKNVARRLLNSCNGELSREAIRDFLRALFSKSC